MIALLVASHIHSVSFVVLHFNHLILFVCMVLLNLRGQYKHKRFEPLSVCRFRGVKVAFSQQYSAVIHIMMLGQRVRFISQSLLLALTGAVKIKRLRTK